MHATRLRCLARVGLAAGLCVLSVGQAAAQYRVLHTFSAIPNVPDGQMPLAPLAFDGSSLYGTTRSSYGTTDAEMPSGAAQHGTVFKINPDGSGYQILHTFIEWEKRGRLDGSMLGSGVTLGEGGALYGGTATGGPAGKGVLYRLQTDGSGFTQIHNFTRAQPQLPGMNPQELVRVGSTLYGATLYSDSLGGMIFQINEDGTGFQTLHEFAGGLSSLGPGTGLSLIGDQLYGTTYQGGAANLGTIFRINLDGTGYQTLREFAGGAIDGNGPDTRLLAADGRIFGTTFAGGASNNGLVFSMAPDGADFRVLYSFAGGRDGHGPDGDLAWRDGVLYGTTVYGGLGGGGTVFRLNDDGAEYRRLHVFVTEASGKAPTAGVLLVGNTLYGTTSLGGTGHGTVFALTIPEPASAALVAFAIAPAALLRRSLKTRRSRPTLFTRPHHGG